MERAMSSEFVKDVVNDDSEFNIRIVATRRRVLSAMPTYVYLDSDSGEELDVDDLGGTDLGFILSAKYLADGNVQCHLPYRVADQWLIPAIRGLRSVTALSPTLVQGITSVSSTLSDFQVSAADYQTLSATLRNNGWELRASRTDYDMLRSSVSDLTKEVSSIIDRFNEFRSNHCMADSKEQPRNDVELTRYLDDLDAVRHEYSVALGRRVDVVNEVSRVRREQGSLRAYELMQMAVESMNRVFTAGSGMDFERTSRELTSRTVVNTGAAVVTATVLPLESELGLLMASYPVLRRIRVVSNDTLEVALIGCSVRVTPNTITVSGSLDSMLPYVGKEVSPDASDGSDVDLSERNRSIRRVKKKTDVS